MMMQNDIVPGILELREELDQLITILLKLNNGWKDIFHETGNDILTPKVYDDTISQYLS